MKRSPLKRKTPIKRSWMRPGKRKTSYRKRERDNAYMLWVKTLDCCVAQELNSYQYCHYPVEADHPWNAGLGRKCSDRLCIPLCSRHHRQKTDHAGYFASMDKLQRRRWLEKWVAATMSRYLAQHGGL